MRKHLDSTGFRPPTARALGHGRCTVACAELLATLALAVSTMIVATVLSVGIARAAVIDGVISHNDRLFGIALLIGLILIGFSGLPLRTRKH